MKIKQQETNWNPVILTLETERELQLFMEIVERVEKKAISASAQNLRDTIHHIVLNGML